MSHPIDSRYLQSQIDRFRALAKAALERRRSRRVATRNPVRSNMAVACADSLTAD